MDNLIALGEEKISRLFWKYTIPAMAGFLINTFYNVVDRVFIGLGVNAMALSGVAVATPFSMILTSFALLVGTGVSIQVAIKLGQGKDSEVELIIGNGVFLAIVLAAILEVACFIVMDPLLYMFGANTQNISYARDFMRINLLSTVFMNIFIVLNSAIAAEGNPVMALIINLTGNVINLALNPLFIFVFNLGVSGSALATMSSQFLIAIWTIYYFRSKNKKIRLNLEKMAPRLSIIVTVVLFGLAPFLIQNLTSAALVVANHVFAQYGGNIALAVVGIVGVLVLFFIQPLTGMGQGIQPIIGYNHGKKSIGRVKETMKLALLYSTLLCLMGFIFTFFFSREIIGLFSGADQEIVPWGTIGIKYGLLSLPFYGLEIIGTMYFQSIGKYKIAILLTVTRLGILLIPMLLILPQNFGLYGGIAAFPVSDVFTSILVLILLVREWRGLDVLDTSENAA